MAVIRCIRHPRGFYEPTTNNCVDCYLGRTPEDTRQVHALIQVDYARRMELSEAVDATRRVSLLHPPAGMVRR